MPLFLQMPRASAATPNRGGDIYGGRDPRSVPVYGLSEAARYLDIPVSTLRAWTLGQRYTSQTGKRRFFHPVISIADPETRQLSFTNVCEAHVCDALRSAHRISLQGIRRAIDILTRTFPGKEHPLVEHEFATAGVDLFLNSLGEVINLTAGGQVAMKECLSVYFRRVEFDRDGMAGRLFPFTRRHPSADAPKIVVLDPRVQAGRPVIVNTRIATSVVYERWFAGESSQSLAEDYGRSLEEIEEALRCEQQAA